MQYYFALVHKDEDSAFGVQFPDMACVFSAAETADEIVSNTVEALQLYATDRKLPEPSSHARILARKDVEAELAKGAFLICVPLISSDTAVVDVSIPFERGLLQAIDETAAARGLTRDAFLASAARREIEA